MVKKVQGRCTKEQCSNEEERTAVCGCLFQCQDWGKGDLYWIRIKDCEKHKEMVRKAIEDANK